MGSDDLGTDIRPATGRGRAVELIVLGAGGGVADISDIVYRLRERGADISIRGLLDDNRPPGTLVYGHEVVGGLTDWHRFGSAQFLSSIRNQNMHHRHDEIIAALGIPADRWATLVDSDAYVSDQASMDRGVYVSAGSAVAAGVSLGEHVSLGPNVTIGHDSTLAEFSIVAAGALLGGRVTVGRCAYLGSGSLIMPNLSIGERALIGMGAVVVRDVPADHVVVGNPARILRIRSDSSTSE